MRVLFLNSIGRIGGGERVLLDVLASLPQVRPGVERRLLLLEEGPLATAARELGVEVDVLAVGTMFHSLGDSTLRSRGRVGAAAGLATRALLAGPQTWRLVRSLRGHITQVA